MENRNVLILGMIGSGKTTMAKRILSITPRAIVLDRKAEYDDGEIFESFAESARYYAANKSDDFHIIVRASNPDEYFLWFRLLLLAQHNEELPPVGFFVEESAIYSDSHNIPQEVEEVYTLGRVPRINIVTVAQRDTQVNPLLRDQCHYLIAMKLRNPAARLREDFGPDELETMRNLTPLTPGTEPEYGVHFVTNVGPEIPIFPDWARHLTAY